MKTLAKRLSGAITSARYKSYRDRLESFRKLSPFVFRELSGGVFRKAIQQNMSTPAYCRSLDRLRLAAMDELNQDRLMTHDIKQASAARALGFEVISPGA